MARASKFTTMPSTAGEVDGVANPVRTGSTADPSPTKETVKTSPALAGLSADTRLPSGRATMGRQTRGLPGSGALEFAAASQEFNTWIRSRTGFRNREVVGLPL